MSKPDLLEYKIHSIGAELFGATRGAPASIFDKGFWYGKIIDYCMDHEPFKVEMFRFVDVMPTLKDADAVARHIKEYFTREGLELPAAIKTAMLGATAFGGVATKMAAGTIEKNVVDMAKRFVVGTTPAEALPVLRKLRDENINFTADLLGEATVSEPESEAYAQRYLAVVDTLAKEKDAWRDNDVIDRGPDGLLPKVNVSLKVSALYSQMDPLCYEQSLEILKKRIRPLMLRARQTGAFLMFDLEQFAFRSMTYDLFMQLCEEPELCDYPHFGIVIQAYLRDSIDDAERLIKWARKRKVPTGVRLVKGAYWEYETVLAKQKGYPSPVFMKKPHSDSNYETITKLLIDAYPTIQPAFGTHNIRSIAHAVAYAREKGLPGNAIEMQSLYGMAEPIRFACIKNNIRQRVYAPIGELLPGMAYLVRRLLENTSNDGFMRQSFVDNVAMEQLLKPPEAPPPRSKDKPARKVIEEGELPPFRNESMLGWANPENREKMRKALDKARKNFGRELPTVVNGKELKTGDLFERRNPSRSDEVVARVHQARPSDVEDAIAAARSFFPTWRDTPPRERCNVLLRAAQLMRDRRFELTALMVLEAGKSWREADADLCEGIDFFEYYAREILRVNMPRHMQPWLPGEDCVFFYEPRGLCAVISTWSFPFAILGGMTAAALGAGNCVLIKPSRQTSALGHELYQILREAKAPAAAVQFVPGAGATIGRQLVEHRDVDLIAFTGSTPVGLEIVKSAAVVREGQRNIKGVIAELGAKNAIIVDDDADVDEAIKGVLFSAFGYGGQKCTACSRAIVLDANYDNFVGRLVEAARSIKVGDAADPATYVGPVIDDVARKSIQQYIELGKKEGKLLLERDCPAGGHFIGPVIFGDVPRNSRIAQEEIFGPVLSIIRAKDFDEALAIALDSKFGLTGGLYSRSPAHIDQVRREFRVGNLYINRGCTGSIVERHPFGGMRMSGAGTKAGSPDYILHFMEGRSIAENSMRRGFAPKFDEKELE